MPLAQNAIVRRLLALIILLFVAVTGRAQDGNAIEFNRDILPILADNCFSCHGSDRQQRKAGLRLDTRTGLFGATKHATVIVPRDPDNSELLRRITAATGDEHMPPAAAKKTLQPNQIRLLRQWILQGAKYEGHWAFQPIRSFTAQPTTDRAASTEILDQLVEKSLLAQQLTTSPKADTITLLRRASFDLIGLPLSEAFAAAFAGFLPAFAYERFVDQLLASPHFGERIAIWWLDLVRYADTVGYHGDQPISVSPYRDHVIAAFNENQPFDQFTIEQLAGDLLPSPTIKQRIASGYNRLGMMSAEGGVQDKEYLSKYLAERVRNAAGTWLGITLGCAECHDHKFDPFTTRDFYRFAAFFSDIKERGLYSGANDDGNWGPSVKAPTTAQSEQLAEQDRAIEEQQRVLDTSTPSLAAAQAAWEQAQVTWTDIAPASMRAKNGTQLSLRADGAILASGSRPDTEVYELSFCNLPAGVTAFRLTVLPDDSLPNHGPGRADNGNFVLTELLATTRNGAEKAQSITLQNPAASFEQTGSAGGNPYGKWAIAAALDGDAKGKTFGWAVMAQAGKPHVAIFETAADLTLTPGTTLSFTLEQQHGGGSHTLGCFRIAVTKAQRPIANAGVLSLELAAAIATKDHLRTDAERNALATHFRSITPLLEPTRERIKSQEQQRKLLLAQVPSSPVTEAVARRTVRVLRRGNWMDETGEIVTAALPAVLATNAPEGRELTRLDLANWLISADNPITARVFVNRIWKLCFGRGLARKLDDIGTQGEAPTHPELLDFLAADFRDHGFDVKRLIKTIVMSRTYRQSSIESRAARERDPDNRWLARQGRFRLDAELVRDNALAISGLLVRTIGGRSVFPYQPKGYWSYLNFPTREWQDGTEDSLYRRGLYTHWQRQYLHPSLLAFDAPTREECTAERAHSNTPLQSLVLLNDPSYVEAARALAEIVLQQSGPSPRQRLDFAFGRALSRPATDAESAVLEALLRNNLAQYTNNPQAAAALLHIGARKPAADLDAALLSAWTNVCRAILNLHEVITRN
jgi:hypothetical protein